MLFHFNLKFHSSWPCFRRIIKFLNNSSFSLVCLWNGHILLKYINNQFLFDKLLFKLFNSLYTNIVLLLVLGFCDLFSLFRNSVKKVSLLLFVQSFELIDCRFILLLLLNVNMRWVIIHLSKSFFWDNISNFYFSLNVLFWI